MRISERLIELVQPLERKLPLMIAALLCAVVTTFGWLANRELSLALERASGERLGVAAQRLATLLTESVVASRVATRRLAGDSAVVAVAERPADSLAKAKILAAFGRSGSPVAQPNTRAVWSLRCERIVIAGPLSDSPLASMCPTAPDSGTVDIATPGDPVHPFIARGDSIFTQLSAPILRSNGDTIGYVAELHATRGGQEGRLLSSLIGKDVSLAIGNARGPEVWTDLSQRVSGPPRTIARGAPVHYAPTGGQEQLGYALEITGSPYLVWVQMPLATAVAAQFRTLRKLALIALLCIALGVAGAWLLGNHVTRPLVEITRAAEDLASGRYSRRVSVTRRDELGHLMSSFNRMAAQVEAANREMSAQADELGQHYRDAQTMTRELEMSNGELNEALSDAKRANEGRELVQSVLDEVLAQAPVGIAVFDADLRYVRLNRAQSQMHGVSIQAHEGRTPAQVATVLGTIDQTRLGRVLSTGETLSNVPCSGTGAEGARRHWLTSYFPIRGTKGDLVGAGAIVLDATAHHELEAQLLQAQKMDAVGRLAGGVAHDFNNLLTVISSYTELAIDTLSPSDPLRTDMKEIRSAADRASRLTRQLLAFSRKQVMQPQIIDLNHVAGEMERMLRRLIGEDVVLSLEDAADLGEVLADPGQIEQVIMNLALNARDAMPDGGTLVIRTANAEVDGDAPPTGVSLPAGSYVTVSVSDTGTGISEDTRAHLFEPFFTTKGTGQGTGLGLSTAFGIVKQSGGDILVQSDVGAGSVFTIFLPRVARATSSVSRTTPLPGAAFGGSETILLVEDDIALRNMAKRVLAAAGYVVLEARSPTSAIDISEQHTGALDLLLTDVVMPLMNGRVVAERIGEGRPGLRVLFMSGYTDDDVVKRGIVSARMEFLQKPFTPEHLMRRIREVLDRPLVA